MADRSRILVTAATSDPVEVGEAKTHLRIDFNHDDALLTSLIAEATQWIQNRTGRQLIEATWRQAWDTLPEVVELTRAPVASVAWVKYYDADEVLTTVNSSDYWVDAPTSRVIPKDGWPTIHDARPGAFQVQYVAGYGSSGASVPPPLRRAILWLVAHWYEQREAAVVNGYVREVPFGVESICGQYETSLL